MSAENCLSPELIAKGKTCGAHWDSVPFVLNLAQYDKNNPVAWQHLADARQLAHDVPHGLKSLCPELSPSWSRFEESCNALIPCLKDACK